MKRLLSPTPFHVPTGSLIIENTDELREQLRRRTWSFSSLKRFFTCPCRFILEEIQGVTPPSCFEEEEHANLLIGDFLHRFFAELKAHPPAMSVGRNDSTRAGRAMRTPDQDSRTRPFARPSSGATWPISPPGEGTGRPLLFSDDVAAAELELKAAFGGGRYQLKGRIDRLQREGEKEPSPI